MNTQEYSTADIVGIIGSITPRQVQWWDERRVVMPRQAGHRRIYSFPQVVEIQIIADLKSKGLSLQSIRKHLRTIQKQAHQISTEISTDLYFLAIGKQAGTIETDRSTVIHKAADAKSSVVIVDIAAIVRRLTRC